MVLQVAADTRQVVQGPDAERRQMIGRADARQHEELRRVHHAARQDDLAAAARDLVAAVDHVAHAHGAVLVEDDALDQGVGDDVDVVAVALDGGPEIGARRAPALLLALGHLVVADAVLLGAIEVVIARYAERRAGADEAVVDLERIALLGDVQRASRAMIFVVVAFVVLRLPEEGQHLAIAPALVAELAPVVVVGGVAAHIEHGVDRRGAAQRLAARPVHAPVVAMLLRHCLVAPVVGRVLAQAGEARRHLELEGGVRRARFEDQDAQRHVFGEAVGDGAAGRAGANDDVIVRPGHSRST